MMSKSKILLLISVFSLVLLAILAVLVASSATSYVDKAVLTWINGNSSPALTTFFVSVTQLGGVIAVTTITLLLIIFMLFKKAKSKAVLIALGVGGASGIAFILKAVFERPRPDLWEWLVHETYFSFPSGHAVGSASLALCIMVLFWQTKWRIPTLIVAALYMGIIGVSRLYLGVHYPTDILGGWLVASAWVAFITALMYRRNISKNAKPEVNS